MSGSYISVAKDVFEAYPGQKRYNRDGNGELYEVRSDEERQLTTAQREFTDKLLALFEETGIKDQLATGGLQAQIALSTIAAGTIAATDESLPQYARAAVVSLAQEVVKQAHDAKCWSAGAVATRRNHTVAQIRDEASRVTVKM
jgi:hypothetical protein